VCGLCMRHVVASTAKQGTVFGHVVVECSPGDVSVEIIFEALPIEPAPRTLLRELCASVFPKSAQGSLVDLCLFFETQRHGAVLGILVI